MVDIPKVFVKASPGLRVKDPYTLQVLKPEGEWKPMESYWMRRVSCGDCIISEDPASGKTPPPIQEAESSDPELVSESVHEEPTEIKRSLKKRGER